MQYPTRVCVSSGVLHKRRINQNIRFSVVPDTFICQFTYVSRYIVYHVAMSLPPGISRKNMVNTVVMTSTES